MNKSIVKTQSPLRLVSNSQKRSIYHVRFVTDTKSKSGMVYPKSGANILLVNEKNEASLQYVSRVDDAYEPRFETGNIDVVDLVGPDWSELSQIWVFPEEGTWGVNEIVVTSEGMSGIQRFSCNQIIGTDENPAAILEKSVDDIGFDNEKYMASMDDYNILKKQLLFCNTSLVLVGAIVDYICNNDIALSTAFLEGGLVGILYLFLLEKQTDCLGSLNKMMLLPFVSGPVRLLLISYITMSCNVFSNQHVLLTYTLGFFTYKISVLIVGMSGKNDLE